MLGLQPEKRLTAREYRERLEAADHFPRSFGILTQLVETITVGDTSVITPDARIAVMAAQYGTVLLETMGVQDPVGTRYFSKWTGPAMNMDTDKAIGSFVTELLRSNLQDCQLNIKI
jgi:hypothetical protein